VSGTFAPGYGSYLLPLKNAFRLQAVDVVFHAYGFQRNQSARNCAFPVPDCSPRWTGLFAAPTFFGRLWRDTPPPAPSMRTDDSVAFYDLLGHRVRRADFETAPARHHWARRGFMDDSWSHRRLASAFALSQCGGVRPPPAQRVKYAFRVSVRKRRPVIRKLPDFPKRGQRNPLPLTFPRLPGIILRSAGLGKRTEIASHLGGSAFSYSLPDSAEPVPSFVLSLVTRSVTQNVPQLRGQAMETGNPSIVGPHS
jgi:hypothetical protein